MGPRLRDLRSKQRAAEGAFVSTTATRGGGPGLGPVDSGRSVRRIFATFLAASMLSVSMPAVVSAQSSGVVTGCDTTAALPPAGADKDGDGLSDLTELTTFVAGHPTPLIGDLSLPGEDVRISTSGGFPADFSTNVGVLQPDGSILMTAAEYAALEVTWLSGGSLPLVIQQTDPTNFVVGAFGGTFGERASTDDSERIAAFGIGAQTDYVLSPGPRVGGPNNGNSANNITPGQYALTTDTNAIERTGSGGVVDPAFGSAPFLNNSLDVYESLEDHTNPGTGYFAFFDLSPANQGFPVFEENFTGLVPGQCYEFTVFGANVFTETAGGADRPADAVTQLDFELDGTPLGSTGVIPHQGDEWLQYRATFEATSSTANLAFINATTGGFLGADLAVDDLSVNRVVTQVPASDFDGDGEPDFCDLDSDNDGIPDSEEGTGDADGDGTPDYLDFNSGASDDESLGNAFGSTVVVDIVGNDINADPTSVAIDDPNYDPATGTLVVPGEGTWTVDPVTGAITFTPEPGFEGDPTPIAYTVEDTQGTVSSATVTVDYVPTAADDESLGNPVGSPVVVDVLANDGDIDPATVAIGDPNYDPATGTLVVPGEGTWTVDPVSGAITFTPEDGFEGDPTPISYTAADDEGNSTSADVVVTYAPVVEDDESLGNPAGEPVTIDVVGNDADDIDPTTVMILDADGGPVAELVVPGEGTWTVDPVTGAITFTPEDGFEGDPTPVDYTAADTDGVPVETPATVTVDYGPAVIDDESLGNEPGTAVTVDVIGNDFNVDPTTVAIDDPNYDPATGTLVVPGEGTWTVDPVSGAIAFTPEPGFEGDPTVIGYTAQDEDGNVVEPAEVVVGYTPEAAPDKSLGNTSGDAVVIDVVGNDPSSDLDPTTVEILDASGNPVTELVVPGEGTWTVDPVTGAIIFTPEDGFSDDPSPIQYQVADDLGQLTSLVDVIVDYLPVAEPDESLNNPAGSTVTIDVLGNDSADIDPTTVAIDDPNYDASTGTLVVPGEGAWTVDPVTGAISFEPEAGFTGDPTTITYFAADANGSEVSAEVVVTYADPEVVADDESGGNTPGSVVTLDVVGNDGDVDPTTVQIIDPATGLPVTELVVPGEGTWTVDPVTGALTFTPESGFEGDPTPVDYIVSSVAGETLTATATITYADPVPPTLAFTGVESWHMVLAALLALGAGTGLALIARRDEDEATA